MAVLFSLCNLSSEQLPQHNYNEPLPGQPERYPQRLGSPQHELVRLLHQLGFALETSTAATNYHSHLQLIQAYLASPSAILSASAPVSTRLADSCTSSALRRRRARCTVVRVGNVTERSTVTSERDGDMYLKRDS